MGLASMVPTSCTRRFQLAYSLHCLGVGTEHKSRKSGRRKNTAHENSMYVTHAVGGRSFGSRAADGQSAVRPLNAAA